MSPNQRFHFGTLHFLLADEIFVTGTAAEVTPVSQIGDDLYFEVGPVSRQLIDDYTHTINNQ